MGGKVGQIIEQYITNAAAENDAQCHPQYEIVEIRDRHRRRAFECDVFTEEEDGLDVHQEGDSPEAIAISRQYLSMIGRALEGLPARTRRAFELYRLSGLTQREIAAELNISTTLVNFMIRDALACCRNLLQNEPELAGS